MEYLHVMGIADQRRGRRIRRVDVERLPGNADRFGTALFREFAELREGTQIKVVGVQALGRFAACTLDLGLAQLRLDCADNTARHLVLEVEDVVK